MTQLHGVDVSSYQAASTLSTRQNIDFAIIKATEGLTWSDPLHSAHVSAARRRGLLVGHYHFAHANSSATAQANHFVSVAQPQSGDVVVLDFEPYNQGVSASQFGTWIVEFADAVRAHLGATPWLYIDGNMLGQLTASTGERTMARIRQMPLWKATYAASAGSLGGWPVLTAWQYSSSPIDSDIFYGDAATWHKLGVPGASSAKPASVAPKTSTTTPFTAPQIASMAKLFHVAAQPTTAVQALQAHLNSFHGGALATDGVAGPLTITALQRVLNRFGASLATDGAYGPLTSAALTAQLNKGTI